jgi:ABC-type phosphate/phosphonate transport system permease subunit
MDSEELETVVMAIIGCCVGGAIALALIIWVF